MIYSLIISEKAETYDFGFTVFCCGNNLKKGILNNGFALFALAFEGDFPQFNIQKRMRQFADELFTNGFPHRLTDFFA